MSTENEQSTALTVTKVDNGKPALFNPAIFDQVWRAAKLFSQSDLVPQAYKGKPENCFIAIEMAERMGVNPFAVIQNLSIIQGKPAMEAKLIIALVNDSGIFVDPLEYEVVGEDPHADNYKVRAFATMSKTGKVCLGPWITWKMVKGEGWLQKTGSKWATMPSIMFMYRAASFFAKVYAPNVTMGMQTREEMDDVPMVNITPLRDIPALIEDEVKYQAGSGAQTLNTAPAEKPARKRGEPSPGNKRRTKIEMEEDARAEAEEKLAEEQGRMINQAPEQDGAAAGCDHPEDQQYQEGPSVMCGACGDTLSTETEELPNLDGPDDGFPSFPDMSEKPAAEKQTVAGPAKQQNPDLF